ncbi:two-component system connector SafA, partial [Escherichia coli]|nr:two-component system connector SafA [Escherichia coli]
IARDLTHFIINRLQD